MKFFLDLKTKLSRLTFGHIMYTWYCYYKLIFLALFLCVLGSSGSYWYASLNRYQWTEEQKKAYLDEYFKETSFKEKEFRALDEKLHAKEESHMSNLDLKRDIFTGEVLAP